MDLTYEEKEFIEKNLTTETRGEIQRIVDEMQAIYLLTKEGGELYRRWMHDSERFMGFTFSHTQALVKHSITLTRWTKYLQITTGFLALFAVVQIAVIILVAVGKIG